MDESEDSNQVKEESSTEEGNASKPTFVIILGMAGSGKTSLVQVLFINSIAIKCNSHLYQFCRELLVIFIKQGNHLT